MEELGIRAVPRSRAAVIRAIRGVAEALFTDETGFGARARAFLRGWQGSLDGDLPAVALHPDEEPRRVTIPVRA